MTLHILTGEGGCHVGCQ